MSTQTLLTESGTNARIMDALDRFPNLTKGERAAIFHALENPTNRPAWVAVKNLDLSGGSARARVTLNEGVRWRAWPTTAQMLDGLNYCIGMLS